MSVIQVGKENSSSIELHYEDLGEGRPVVLIHGFPLSGRSWEKQTVALLEAGFRVVTYDRRGFGQSSQPATGYDYDTLTADLDQLMTQLDLHDVTLVGFSMGGGEVARYLGTHGAERVRKAVFISAVPPHLKKTPEDPHGVESSVFDEIQAAIRADRPAFLTQFFKDFYNLDQLLGQRISEEVVRDSWQIAVSASPVATHAVVPGWGADFRRDLAKIQVPTLVIHGDQDRIVPVEAAGRRTHALISGSLYVELEGAPHGLLWTHADEVNRALLDFLESDQTLTLKPESKQARQP